MKHEVKSDVTFANFKHYCIIGSILLVSFGVTFAASFTLPDGVLNFAIKVKSVCMICSSVSCISAAYLTDYFNTWARKEVSEKHFHVKNEEKLWQSAFEDQAEKNSKDDADGFISGVHFGDVTFLSLNPIDSASQLLKVVFEMSESAFVGFDHNATLVLLYELFVCTCRYEVRTFSALGCSAKIAALSAFSFSKDVAGRVAQFFFVGAMSEISVIIHRVVDASFSFIVTMTIAYLAFRVARSTAKSVRFQQKNSSAEARSLLSHPLLRIVVATGLIQIIHFAYYLSMVVGYIPSADMEMYNEDRDEYRRFARHQYYAFWSLGTHHQIMLQIFSLIGILLIFLSRIQIPVPSCVKWHWSKRRDAEAGEAGEAS